jgi:hypothetical protein
MGLLTKYKNLIRIGVLICLVIVIIGPWTYSSDGTPPAAWCSEPNILLDNERCVRLVSGGEILTIMTGGFLALNAQLLTGSLNLVERAREYFGVTLFVLLISLLLLPFINLSFQILRGNHQTKGMYTVLAWGLAALLSGLLLVGSYWSGLQAPFWGMWLYVGLAIAMLLLELRAVVGGKWSG